MHNYSGVSPSLFLRADEHFIDSRPYTDANGTPLAGAHLITRPWLRRIWNVWSASFDASSQSNLEGFAKVTSIDDDTKILIGRRVKESILLIVAWQAWWDVINGILALYVRNFQLSRILSVLLPLIVFRLNDGVEALLIESGISLCVFYLSWYFLAVAEFLLARIQKSESEWIILALGCICVVLGLRELRHLSWSPILIHGIWAGFIAVIIYYSIALTIMLLWKALTKYIEVTKRQRYPQEEIIQTLCSLLASIEGVGDELSASNRSFYLEWTASVVERDLARTLRTFDVCTDAWIQRALIRRAGRLRELKRFVMFPGATSNAELKQALSKAIKNAAGGQWQSLQENVDEIQRPLERKRTILRAVRPVALLLFLIAVVAYVSYGNNSLFEPLKGNIVPGAITGVILMIASLLDPEHSKILSMSASPSASKT